MESGNRAATESLLIWKACTAIQDNGEIWAQVAVADSVWVHSPAAAGAYVGVYCPVLPQGTISTTC